MEFVAYAVKSGGTAMFNGANVEGVKDVELVGVVVVWEGIICTLVVANISFKLFKRLIL